MTSSQEISPPIVQYGYGPPRSGTKLLRLILNSRPSLQADGFSGASGIDLPDRPPGHFLTVLFEDLVANIERELDGICRHLRLRFSPTMLKHHETTMCRPSIAGTWRPALHPDEIRLRSLQ